MTVDLGRMGQDVLHQRRQAVWDSAQNAGCEACLVYGTDGHSEAFRYLTDYEPFIGDRWLLMHGQGAAVGVLTFGWSIDEAKDRSGVSTWEAHFDPHPIVLQHLERLGVSRLATVGAERMPFSLMYSIVENLGRDQVIDLDGAVSSLRRIKDAQELGRLRAAAKLTDQALVDVRSVLRPGITERDLLRVIAQRVYGSGASLAFEPLIVSGRDEAVVARGIRTRALMDGDPVMLDLGFQVDGYQSDVARTYFVGTPSTEQQIAWKAVEAALAAILSVVKPGVSCNELNAVGWDVIRSAGYETLHRMGHGVGLATSYEWPDLEADTDPLQAGMTLAIEPGVYVAGVGSLKLEEMVVVTESGFELLSKADRSPMLSHSDRMAIAGKEDPE